MLWENGSGLISCKNRRMMYDVLTIGPIVHSFSRETIHTMYNRCICDQVDCSKLYRIIQRLPSR